MKKLKTITIKIESHIDDKYKFVVDEKTGNLNEVYDEVKELFDENNISDNTQDNEVKKRYNKTVDDIEKELLTEMKMAIFTKACEENLKETKSELKETKSELKETNSKLKETNSKLLATESRLNELEKILKTNGLI